MIVDQEESLIMSHSGTVFKNKAPDTLSSAECFMLGQLFFATSVRL